MVPYRLSVTDPNHPGTVLSNLVWIFFNMIILGVAGAVANEQKQRRSSVRIPAQISVHAELEDGRKFSGLTVDMSVGGASMVCAESDEFAQGTELAHLVPAADGRRQHWRDGCGQVQERAAATVRRADDLGAGDPDARSLLACRFVDELAAEYRAGPPAGQPWARDPACRSRALGRVLAGLLPAKKAKSAAALILITLLLTHHAGVAQIPGTVGATPDAAPAVSLPAEPAISAPAEAPVVQSDAVMLPPPDVTAITANDKITLKDMGVHGTVEMHGPHSYYSVGFVLPNDRVPRHATLELTSHFNASILTHTGSIKVLVNGTPVGILNAPQHPQKDYEYGYVTLNVPADVLIRNNELTFEFTGGTALQVDTKAKSVVLANIGDSSRILVAGDSVPLKTDLGLLPHPFFDPDLQTTTTIPFVFLAPPTPQTLQAAAVVASWFGIQTSSKPVHFTVAIGRIPVGNVVVFANQNTGANQSSGLESLLNIPQGGASLSIRTNPSDPQSSAMVLAGDDDTQLLLVARSLALMTVAHPGPGEPVPSLGESVRLKDFPLPDPRQAG